MGRHLFHCGMGLVDIEGFHLFIYMIYRYNRAARKYITERPCMYNQMLLALLSLMHGPLKPMDLITAQQNSYRSTNQVLRLTKYIYLRMPTPDYHRTGPLPTCMDLSFVIIIFLHYWTQRSVEKNYNTQEHKISEFEYSMSMGCLKIVVENGYVPFWKIEWCHTITVQQRSLSRCKCVNSFLYTTGVL